MRLDLVSWVNTSKQASKQARNRQRGYNKLIKAQNTSILIFMAQYNTRANYRKYLLVTCIFLLKKRVFCFVLFCFNLLSFWIFSQNTGSQFYFIFAFKIK